MLCVDIMNLPSPEDLREKIEWNMLIPRRFDIPVGLQSFKPFVLYFNVVIAVPNEIDGNLTSTDFLPVQMNESARWGGRDVHCSAHAGRKNERQRDAADNAKAYNLTFCHLSFSPVFGWGDFDGEIYAVSNRQPALLTSSVKVLMQVFNCALLIDDFGG